MSETKDVYEIKKNPCWFAKDTLGSADYEADVSRIYADKMAYARFGAARSIWAAREDMRSAGESFAVGDTENATGSVFNAGGDFEKANRRIWNQISDPRFQRSKKQLQRIKGLLYNRLDRYQKGGF